MKFEDALRNLRNGAGIYRTLDPEKGYLCGSLKQVTGSFYMTLYDILAEDWEIMGLNEDDDE